MFWIIISIFQKDFYLDTWLFTVIAEPFRIGTPNISKGNILRLLCKYSLNGDHYEAYLTENYGVQHPYPGEEMYKKETWVKVNSSFIYVGIGFISDMKYDGSNATKLFTFDNKNNLIDSLNYTKFKDEKESILVMDEENKEKIKQAREDQDVISIDFSKLDNNISTIVIVIKSSNSQKFNTIYDAFIRLFDKQGPLGINAISEFGDEDAIIFGQFKKFNETWYFEPLHVTLESYEEEDIIGDVKECIIAYPLKLNNIK